MWGTNPSGKTLGILGFGRIGQAVARRARGFSMRILYHSVDRPTPEQEQELGAQYVDRETLLREADFLSIHVPLAPDTHHLIGAAELALMKPTAFLINTSRGKVVEEAALIEALQSKRIAGAGLDVFEFEPQIHPALLAMPNVVVSPAHGHRHRRDSLGHGHAGSGKPARRTGGPAPTQPGEPGSLGEVSLPFSVFSGSKPIADSRQPNPHFSPRLDMAAGRAGLYRLRKNSKVRSFSTPPLYPLVSTTPALSAPPLLI